MPVAARALAERTATDGAAEPARALPYRLRTGVEALSGVSMDSVRVHYNSSRPSRLGALAFAQGSSIYLTRGQERHLPHEAWHVAQQRQGRVPTRLRMAGLPINADRALEREASRMGAAAERVAPPEATVDLAPAPDLSPAAQAEAPIQGWWPFSTPDPHALPPALTADIAALQRALASAGPAQRADPAWYSAQQDRLHVIEQGAHAWARTHGHLATDAQRTAMAAHLGNLEDHHRALIGVQRANNHPLWLPAGVTRKQAQRARRVWRDVQANDGNLQINSPDDAFRDTALAGIAKLLETQHGRTMLTALNRVNHGGNPKQVRISGDWSGKFAKAGRPPRAGSWATPLNAGTQAEEQGGAGIGSYVQVDTADRRLVTGEHGDRGIPMPLYVTLGHELGHALHNMRGQKRIAWPIGHVLTPAEVSLWNNPEEYANIRNNENAIRDQHGLPRRAYHKPPGIVPMDRLSTTYRERIRYLAPAIDAALAGWAHPNDPAYGTDPVTNARIFDPMDERTFGNAGRFFGLANAEIDRLEHPPVLAPAPPPRRGFAGYMRDLLEAWF